MIRYVGLDVHRESVVVCMLNSGGEVLRTLNVACTRPALETFARAELTRDDQLVLEATFNCWAVLSVLRPFVDRIAVSNPLTTKAIAQSKVKTDKVDARVLADLLRCGYLPEVWVPDAETQQRRTLTHRRAVLVSDRTRLKNRIHSVLAQALIPRYAGDLFSQAGQQWLSAQPLSELERALIAADQELLASVQVKLAELEKVLVAQAYADERVRLLMTLPGVDYTVALGILSALGDIARFGDGDHAASYFGLVPSTRQSADRCHHGPITKRGSRHGRWLLIQAAQHLGKNPGPLGVFYRRLRKKKNHNVAVVAAARKLVVIAWHMLTTGEPYRYAQPRILQDKLARLRIKATGKRKKTGPPRTGKPAPNQGTGVRMRTVPALARVLAEEGMPPARGLEELPEGERRALAAAGVLEYARRLANDQRVRRSSLAAEGSDREAAAKEDTDGAPEGERLA